MRLGVGQQIYIGYQPHAVRPVTAGPGEGCRVHSGVCACVCYGPTGRGTRVCGYVGLCLAARSPLACLLAAPEPRRYSRYSVSRYSSDTAGVYQYSRYRNRGVMQGNTADTADTAVIQQRYSSDIAAIQQMQQMQQIQQIQQQVQQLQCRYNNRPQ